MSPRAVAWCMGLAASTVVARAHASSMDGLAVVVVGVFVAVPAALILLLMISAMAIALGKPHPGVRLARIVQFTAPPLAAIYPLIFVFLGDTRNMEGALFFDLPLIALGVLALILASLVVRKHERGR